MDYNFVRPMKYASVFTLLHTSSYSGKARSILQNLCVYDQCISTSTSPEAKESLRNLHMPKRLLNAKNLTVKENPDANCAYLAWSHVWEAKVFVMT